MKKLLIALLVTPFLANATTQNFNHAKTELIRIYKKNPQQKEFYCGCDFRFIGKKGIVDLASCHYQSRKNQKRAERIEWEHVMPAENFGRNLQCWKTGGRKNCKKDAVYTHIEGDMHNLQPAVGEVNGDRSNYGYSLFTKTFHQYGQCPTAVDFKNHQFQPRTEIRGMIARTYLYMSDRYHLPLSKQDQNLMSAWDRMYPPIPWECQRNVLIRKKQGNDNPYITTQCANNHR